MKNFIIFIALCVSPLLIAGQNPLTDAVVLEIKTVSNTENISNQELEKAYIAFRSAYIYGKEFEFEGTESFGELADKQRKILEKLKYVPNIKLSDAAFKVLQKYEDADFDSQHKAEYLDDVYHISEGVKAAME